MTKAELYLVLSGNSFPNQSRSTHTQVPLPLSPPPCYTQLGRETSRVNPGEWEREEKSILVPSDGIPLPISAAFLFLLLSVNPQVWSLLLTSPKGLSAAFLLQETRWRPFDFPPAFTTRAHPLGSLSSHPAPSGKAQSQADFQRTIPPVFRAPFRTSGAMARAVLPA